jgi:hypothetical protein
MAIEGLLALIRTEHITPTNEILRMHGEGKHFQWWYAIIAGLDLYVEQGGRIDDLKDEFLRAALVIDAMCTTFIYKGNTLSQYVHPWKTLILESRPALAAAAYSELARFELARSAQSALGLHDLLTVFGMYEYCRDRYISLEQTKWDKKKSWKERLQNMSRANPGRSYDAAVDLTSALEKHYNPSLVLEKLKQVHELLKDDTKLSDEELAKRGWNKGYNLTVWTEMPGEVDSRALYQVLLQVLTGGRMGLTQTGPGFSFRTEARQLREAL